jgi:hypothetical protein
MVKHITANVPASISVSLNRQQHALTTRDTSVDTTQPTYSKHLLLSSTTFALARIRMSLMAHKPASHAIGSITTATILLMISFILLSSVTTIALALPNSLVSSNFNGAFTGWVNQCIQAKLANNNNNSSSVPRVIANPTFALANAKASCTQLLQGYINSNNQLTTIQNQPTSSTTPTYPNQYQNPSSYPYLPQQQQSQAANTPTPQYPYQTPYQYPYQQPYPSTNQQQSPATNNAAVPPTSQYPYPYQQPQQQQNQSSSSVSNPAQYPYQQQQQQQPQQQPQSSQSFTAGQPSVSTLIIVTHVNSTGGSNNNTNPPPANFTQVVENAFTNPDGYTYVYHYMKGSEAGVTVGLQPGTFGVFELKNNNNIKANAASSSQSTYDVGYSGDCRTVKSITGGATYGNGTINPGETKTCTVTLSSHK